MKKQYFLVLLLTVFLVFTGCVSTPSDNGLYYENVQTGEKLLIREWKYMGFQQPFPQWVIPALENNKDKIKEVESSLGQSEIIILKSEGFNQDQAEFGLKELVVPEGYQLYDSFWVGCVKSNQNNLEKVYISVAVYYIN